MTFEALVSEITDASGPIAAAKLAGLSRITEHEATYLADAWMTIEPERRAAIVRNMRELAEDNVELDFDTVFLRSLCDPEPEVRREAISGLWEHEGQDVIDPLLELLEHDPDASVRADTAQALGQFVLRAEFEALPERQASRIETALQRTYTDPTEPVEVRGRALEALGARSEPWVSDLIEDAFASGDRRLELSAVHAMGRSADPAWLSYVLGQLESEDAEMRFEASVAAGEIADPEATVPLEPLLHDDDMEVRLAAINALGQIGGEHAKELLQDLRSEHEDHLEEAIEAALAEVEFNEDPLGYQLSG